VAQAAGVGLTWYTWLEQGRDIRVSADVLCAIARALQLEPVERVHLFRLAGHEPPAGSVDEAVRPAHRNVLESWEPFPAYVVGRRWDVLAWNRGARALFGDYGALPEGRRNLLWCLFLLPDRRRLHREWSVQAETAVASFRAEAAQYLGEPAFQSLLSELRTESREFAELWERRDVHGRSDGLKRLRHPTLGDLDLEHTSYHVNDQPGLKMVLYTPAPRSRSERVLRSLDLSDAGVGSASG
jgi:transcriptional regulator with XRE-family HTH domain